MFQAIFAAFRRNHVTTIFVGRGGTGPGVDVGSEARLLIDGNVDADAIPAVASADTVGSDARSVAEGEFEDSSLRLVEPEKLVCLGFLVFLVFIVFFHDAADMSE